MSAPPRTVTEPAKQRLREWGIEADASVRSGVVEARHAVVRALPWIAISGAALGLLVLLRRPAARDGRRGSHGLLSHAARLAFDLLPLWMPLVTGRAHRQARPPEQGGCDERRDP